MLGWYFCGRDRTLRYGDGRKIVVGETHTVKGPPKLCVHAYPVDADRRKG